MSKSTSKINYKKHAWVMMVAAGLVSIALAILAGFRIFVTLTEHKYVQKSAIDGEIMMSLVYEKYPTESTDDIGERLSEDEIIDGLSSSLARYDAEIIGKHYRYDTYYDVISPAAAKMAVGELKSGSGVPIITTPNMKLPEIDGLKVYKAGEWQPIELDVSVFGTPANYRPMTDADYYLIKDETWTPKKISGVGLDISFKNAYEAMRFFDSYQRNRLGLPEAVQYEDMQLHLQLKDLFSPAASFMYNASYSANIATLPMTIILWAIVIIGLAVVMCGLVKTKDN